MIISETPLRLSFFGGGTDYCEYFEREEGAVIGTTIDKFVRVSVNRLSDFFDHKIRVGYSKAELKTKIEDIEHPSVRETLKFLKMDESLDIHIFNDLPARTGLGSSSSFTVGLLNALYRLKGEKVSKQQLAESAVKIEQDLIGETVGCQDQYHAAFGGFNLIRFNAGGVSIEPVKMNQEKSSYLNNSLILFYTGQTRFASEILKEQVAHTKSGTKDSWLRTLREYVFRAKKLIEQEEPLAMVSQLGELLDESWAVKKSLSSQISNGLIDEYYKKAKGAGAWGGKIAGAGSGGFLFFLVPLNKKEPVRSALAPLKDVHFNFEKEGSRIIYG